MQLFHASVAHPSIGEEVPLRVGRALGTGHADKNGTLTEGSTCPVGPGLASSVTEPSPSQTDSSLCPRSCSPTKLPIFNPLRVMGSSLHCHSVSLVCAWLSCWLRRYWRATGSLTCFHYLHRLHHMGDHKYLKLSGFFFVYLLLFFR